MAERPKVPAAWLEFVAGLLASAFMLGWMMTVEYRPPPGASGPWSVFRPFSPYGIVEVLAMLGPLVGAVLHRLLRQRLGFALLMIAAVLQASIMVIRSPSIGLLLAPAIALAVTAVALGLSAEPGWTARQTELANGLAAGALGLLTMAYLVPELMNSLVTLPATAPASGLPPLLATGQLGRLRQQFPPASFLYVMTIGLCSLGIAVAAFLHSQRDARLGQLLLWGATAVLWFGVMPLTLSVGVLLFPAALLGAVAAISSTTVARGRSEAVVGP